MDWLLISRDYACNDGAFPEAYVLNVTKANNLLKLVIHAFKWNDLKNYHIYACNISLIIILECFVWIRMDFITSDLS